MWPIMIWRRQDSFARVLGHLSDTRWELFHSLIFCTTVEQALGVELQHLVTTEMHKTSGGEKSRSQSDKKGQSGGPIHKKGKFQHHKPYHGKSSQSSISDKNATHYRAVAKPGMGLVCFRCGDAHRR